MQRDLAMALETTGNLPRAFRGILETLLKVKGLDCGGIYLRETRTGRIVLAAHRGLSPEFVRRTAVYTARSRVGQLVLRGKPVYFDESMPVLPVVRAEGLRSVASIPVRSARAPASTPPSTDAKPGADCRSPPSWPCSVSFRKR